MNLIDLLRQGGAILRDNAPSHVPSVNETAEILGALVAHAEHGETFSQAVNDGADAVVRLLGGQPAESATPAGAAPEAPTIPVETPAAPADDKLDQLLKAVETLATAVAAGQHPTVSNLDQQSQARG